MSGNLVTKGLAVFTIGRVKCMEEEAQNAIIEMVKEINRLDVLEYLKIITSDILEEIKNE